ncbi:MULTISPECIES: hypothetical protein [Burkholderia cepacia complex]|uniref:hypothetical protein n=1 Tax=Burkholderia cepacia complex TaxID=87882 RepID=UPI0021AB2297|nr:MULTISPECIES: hypothetical protein [Burkholderia cepacia complex]
MTIQNDFLAFASGAGANVMPQAAYAALSAIAQGYQSGTANSAACNKTWRQSSIMSAVLARFIVAQSGQPAIDDGTTDTLLANLTGAVQAAAGTTVLTDTGTANVYQAANPSPMTALPVTSGVRQFVKIKTTNTGPSTYAPDGLPAAPIFGMSAQQLQGGELGAAGYANLVSVISPAFNSGSLCWVLTNSLLGALPVFPGSAGQHAAQYGQLLQRTNGRAGAVAYGGAPSANWTQTRTLTFTASSNGFVVAQQTVISGQQPAGIQSTVTVSAGSSTSETDHSQLPMVDTGVLSVQAGQAVTVTGTVLADNYSGAWLPTTVTLWYVFVPSN